MQANPAAGFPVESLTLLASWAALHPVIRPLTSCYFALANHNLYNHSNFQRIFHLW